MGLRWRIYSGREESTLIDEVLTLNESALLGSRRGSRSPGGQSPDAADFMQMEEYMMIDSVYHNMHQDMHLDVDTMSYEELLTLEEQIGNVSAGLTEDAVQKNLKRRKYPYSAAYMAESCCICQEDYADGEDLGKWLVQQNVCPLCKKMALST
ncbi:unnamed protein product [Spirodela intermedia]|uniref:RING-type E3 ubiquitin transferase n=1 Tax=Spirodela intermedia TaxID=51605 RepID=A0A7I8JR52_SPIIN|nr:unnamed protein product [Spirodela intermedia]CAA6672624.1 unnamed protein product [Spirodela intermedia]